MTQTISVAYSPDADDAFMFWALETGRLKHVDFDFTFQSMDTQSLNNAAREKIFDICAVSIGTLPHIFDEYRLLPHGGSVGEGYGPVVVCRKEDEAQNWQEGPVAIPGENTTAALVLRLLLPGVRTVEVPITPFEEAFNCLSDGRAIASLLIHEGRLTYEDNGCRSLLDIGEAWQEKFQLPLPLGGNVIRRHLTDEVTRGLNDICQKSIRLALDNKEEAMEHILDLNLGNLNSKEKLSRYLDMYANEMTLGYSSSCYQAIEKLMLLGAEAGLLPPVAVEEVNGSYWR
jgi:1,4-dihydroxy-6-naphthoate synthase